MKTRRSNSPRRTTFRLRYERATSSDKSQRDGGDLRISRVLLLVLTAVACLAGSINEASAASLTIARSGCAATITWTNAADVLETNSTLGRATWAPVTGASSPFPVSVCGTGVNFYRLNLGGGGTNYSDNIVGYINVAVPRGFTLIANQVDNQPDNSLKTLFPVETTADLTVVYKYDNGLGGFSSDQIVGGTWSSGGGATLNPGEGAFVFAPVAFTATFVGRVELFSTVNVPLGFSILSSAIPQQGAIYDTAAPGDGNTDLQYGIPLWQQPFYQFNNGLGGYASYQFSGSWSSEPGPILKVGESFFTFYTGEIHNWMRTFVVGPP
jgi:hypothetical protein